MMITLLKKKKNFFLAAAFLASQSFAQGLSINHNVGMDLSRDTRVVNFFGESAKIIYEFLDAKEIVTGDALSKNAKEISCSKLNNDGGYNCSTTVSKKGKFYSL